MTGSWVTAIGRTLVATFGIVLVFGAQSGSAQILIDDSPLEAKDTLAMKPFVAYRKIPEDAIAKLDPSSELWVLSGHAVLGSARIDPVVNLTFTSTSNNSRGLEEAVTAYFVYFAANTVDQSDPENSNSTSTVPILASYRQSPSEAPQTIDAVAVRNMFDAGVALRETTKSDGKKSNKLSVVLDSSFAEKTKAIYETISAKHPGSISTPYASILADTTKIALLDNRVTSATLVRLGDIGFGIPLASPAQEKKLVIEQSIANKYDVYWIEFVISPGEELTELVSELFFLVTLQNASAIALELVPLRYGTEKSISETKKTPEVSIETGKGKITVGEVYEQSVEYKHLKPTVLATGLRETQFGWRLRDEALDASSKRLIAVIGVPKQTREVAVSMAVIGTIKRWIPFQSEKGSTEPHFYVINLRN